MQNIFTKRYYCYIISITENATYPNQVENIDKGGDFFRVLASSYVIYNRTKHNRGFSIC